jgi:hypothetical protein
MVLPVHIFTRFWLLSSAMKYKLPSEKPGSSAANVEFETQTGSGRDVRAMSAKNSQAVAKDLLQRKSRMDRHQLHSSVVENQISPNSRNQIQSAVVCQIKQGIFAIWGKIWKSRVAAELTADSIVCQTINKLY